MDMREHLREIEEVLCGDKASFDLDRLRELVEADRDGRIIILPAALPATCGSCANFRRTPGKRSGICSVRSLNRNALSQSYPALARLLLPSPDGRASSTRPQKNPLRQIRRAARMGISDIHRRDERRKWVAAKGCRSLRPGHQNGRPGRP